MIPLIVILGPTSSGKTALSLELAKEFHGAIISADSRQVYRGLDIGTSKVSEEDQKKIPHYLIDEANPEEEFTLAHYQYRAFEVIEKLSLEGKLPFLVGGTGLYIDAVVENFFIPEVSPNKKLREELEKLSREELQKKLFKIDESVGACHGKPLLDINNPRRIIRAIEIIQATGKKWSELRKKGERKYRVLKLSIDWPREELYWRSDQTIDKMFEDGLREEVEELIRQGVSKEWLQSLGLEYRAIIENWEIQKLKFAQHAYIRRQLTWFRRDKEIHWLKPETSLQESQKLIEKFIS